MSMEKCKIVWKGMCDKKGQKASSSVKKHLGSSHTVKTEHVICQLKLPPIFSKRLALYYIITHRLWLVELKAIQVIITKSSMLLSKVQSGQDTILYHDGRLYWSEPLIDAVIVQQMYGVR